MGQDLSAYLAGEKLYGDDFSPEQITDWFQHETLAQAPAEQSHRNTYRYLYHQLNQRYGFRHLSHHAMRNALVLGTPYGDQLLPIARQLEQITILYAGDVGTDMVHVDGTPCRYVKPLINGDLPFTDGEFDLITSFGVMPHVPNVSHVLGECFRSLRPGGILLLREPIVSMGDWSKPRPGLTKYERGIPRQILRGILRDVGFEIKQESLCMFSVTSPIARKLGLEPYNHRLVTFADAMLSSLFSWNDKYHRIKKREKLGPTAVYYRLQKAA
ncbi:class I SAM-dependent methyltransferase [filamentous cyanobacterium LEGE 11480]|uniref:Class I SAM-dependent methyltransferase n=1 Tax=Romeriopsis navalis LEGE 11480 TaxID=2777977 RepID=A0A928Z7V4_9CYAN|nr:class I SAM-dependent methyltransferase [Romeriopsis navalis]MBE9033530.1 class I SAM-dependent methyltransferase [Romeriopsis navalis LEGE 11480]